jgi:O-antigen ligase
LGRGFGSYDHASYRILDSDFLGRLIDMGILGLAAYVLMMLSVVATARPVIRSRHPTWAPVALACAAAGVATLVGAALFDELSFPHDPYIFLTLAGFLAAIATRSRVES